jgi:uncharacterized membrane-anchored protein
MDQKRFKCILSVLERYKLTLREKHFVEAVKNYFSENGKVTDQQESILEGLFREKIWMNKVFLIQTE